MANFIDKTFTIVADLFVKILPAGKQEKTAYSYYKEGMVAYSEGKNEEALENFYEALQYEEDAYDRSYALYNIGLIYNFNGNYAKAIEYYHQALGLNPKLPQALNNIAIIYHKQGLQILEEQKSIGDKLCYLDKNLKERDMVKEFFDKAAEYWIRAIELAPDNYPEALNWLKTTGRL